MNSKSCSIFKYGIVIGGVLISHGAQNTLHAEESKRDRCMRITGASYIVQVYIDTKGRLICVHDINETGEIERRMSGGKGIQSRFSADQTPSREPFAKQDDR